MPTPLGTPPSRGLRFTRRDQSWMAGLEQRLSSQVRNCSGRPTYRPTSQKRIMRLSLLKPLLQYSRVPRKLARSNFDTICEHRSL